MGAEESAPHRVALPGFSVDAPAGKVVERSQSPTSGKYEIKLPRASLLDHFLHDDVRNASFVAHWTNQSTGLEEWETINLPLYLKAMEATLKQPKVLHREVIDERRWFVVVGGDRVPLGIAVTICDPRFQVEVELTRFHELDPQIELTRRTLRSIECRVTDENRAGLTPAIRLPKEFGSVPLDAGFQFQSLEGEVLVVNFTGGRLPDSEYYDPAIHALLTVMDKKVQRSALETVAPSRRRRHESERMTRARLPSLDVTAYVGSLYCEKEGASLMFIWLAPQASDALSWERFGQVGCPTGEALSSPTYASLLEDACKRGDTSACEIRKSL